MLAFDVETADQAWLLATQALRKQSDKPLQAGRGGDANELLHVLLHVKDPRQRWAVSRDPVLSVAFAVVEVIGILNGRQDSGYLNFFNRRLPELAGDGPVYHGAYGFRLRSNIGFDQLQRASEALQSNPAGRQVVLQIWDGTKDFPSPDGRRVAEDVPCNICSMLKVREGKLEWSQIMRSNDLFKGLPYNFVQFMTLQEVIAGWLGVELGTYSHFSDSLHLYKPDMKKAFESKERKAELNSDSLALPKEQADRIWSEMNRRVDLLVEKDLPNGDLVELARIADAPQSFTNLMALVVADAARRRERFQAAQDVMSLCDNPLYGHLWSRWEQRWKMPQPTFDSGKPGTKTGDIHDR